MCSPQSTSPPLVRTVGLGEVQKEWGRETNMRGLLSSLCLFSDSLSATNIRTLHHRGRGDGLKLLSNVLLPQAPMISVCSSPSVLRHEIWHRDCLSTTTLRLVRREPASTSLPRQTRSYVVTSLASTMSPEMSRYCNWCSSALPTVVSSSSAGSTELIRGSTPPVPSPGTDRDTSYGQEWSSCQGRCSPSCQSTHHHPFSHCMV